jgi:hypothetical protein
MVNKVRCGLDNAHKETGIEQGKLGFNEGKDIRRGRELASALEGGRGGL